MKKNIPFIIILLLIVLVLAYQFYWFSYILLILAGLGLIFLLILGLFSLIKRPKRKLIRSSAKLVIICLGGILISLFRPYEDPIIENGTPSERLEYAYQTDQKDRKLMRSYIWPFSKMEERDSIRLEQVKELYSEAELNPTDKFHAAFVFHHSDNSADYRIASQLAAQAAESEKLKDNYTAQWLHKAAFDRYMLSIGKPEKYGTQNSLSIDIE